MSLFPYDTRFVYPSQEEAQEALEAQQGRIDFVLPWLLGHGAPTRNEINIECNGFPSQTGPVVWCTISLVFEGIDDDEKPQLVTTSLYHALSRPDICLMDLSRALGSADPGPEKAWRRKASKQIALERWFEPEPKDPTPVPRPFGPHQDQFDMECMLSNAFDHFKTGAIWREPDGTDWIREGSRRGHIRYYRWRQISTV